MNTEFWFCAGLMLLTALAILLIPLFSKKPLRGSDGGRRNLKIARQQAAELKLLLAQGQLSAEHYAAQYAELQQNLDADLDPDPLPPASSAASGRWLAWVLLALIPAVSLGLYWHLGDTEALAKLDMQKQQQENADNVRNMIGRLVDRLQQNPNDLKGWMMLGKAYVYLQDYQMAVDVFAKLYEMQPDNPDIVMSYANSLAMSRGGNLAGEPAELTTKALRLAPRHEQALWLAGMAAADAGEYGKAADYWRTLAEVLPADNETQPQLRQMIAEMDAQAQQTAAGAARREIHAQVTLDEKLTSQVKPGQTLFVYAQALNGPKMPLAIVRKLAADLPLKVTLDDSQAMRPGLHLSDYPSLRIVARISKSGEAIPQPGDLIGSAELQNPETEQQVAITINQEVK